jgi:inosine/xanthosine triphosphatase
MTSPKICVGSLNPVKFQATKEAFSHYYKDFELFNFNANSKVSDQPIGKENIIMGALNRAEQSLNYLNKNGYEDDIYGVGIEAGLVEVPHTNSGYMDFQYAVIIDKNKTFSLGAGIAFEYPRSVINKVLSRKNTEIGEIMGELADNEDLKYEEGAIGYLSKNIITRKEILTQAVICALLPIINKTLYKV